jgi:hypothetical protein
VISEKQMQTVNPFGSLEPERFKDFESTSNILLPKEYADYLMKFNGGLFIKDTISTTISGYSVSNMFGIHNGPDYLQLDRNCNPKNYYDLSIFSGELSPFFVFGDCGTGELLMLNIVDGSVHLLDPELCMNENIGGLLNAIIFVADSFEAFVEKLMSAEEYLNKKLTESELTALEQRLNDLRREFDAS